MCPRFLTQTNGSLGDVMGLCDRIMSEIDRMMALNLAIGLEERMNSGDGKDKWALDPLPANNAHLDYKPLILSLVPSEAPVDETS